VLQQLSFAMRHNQELAARVVAHAKAATLPLAAPFACALLLAAAGVPRHADNALNTLRSIVVRACDTAVRLEQLSLADAARHLGSATLLAAPVRRFADDASLSGSQAAHIDDVGVGNGGASALRTAVMGVANGLAVPCALIRTAANW
jgi:hypothetical protein